MTILQSQRGAMRPISRAVRAYFAPVTRAVGTPSVFDPARDGQFQLDRPPSPWIDAKWVSNFSRTSTTKFVGVKTGAKSATQQQFRSAIESTLTFEFREWGKLQMAISGGSQHMNLLEELSGDLPSASGGLAVTAPVAVLPGSSAIEVVVGLGAVDGFSLGDVIAVDIDYAQQTGYLGSGIAGAFVKNATDVQSDANYVRRVTFNVARISGKTQSSLLLGQALMGGVPPAGAQVQKVKGFIDREGGSFFQEWSGLFVCESETGARILYHYPRLQSAASAQEKLEKIDTAFDAWPLKVILAALPTKDTADNEQVLCYRSYIPAPNVAIY